MLGQEVARAPLTADAAPALLGLIGTLHWATSAPPCQAVCGGWGQEGLHWVIAARFMRQETETNVLPFEKNDLRAPAPAASTTSAAEKGVLIFCIQGGTLFLLARKCRGSIPAVHGFLLWSLGYYQGAGTGFTKKRIVNNSSLYISTAPPSKGRKMRGCGWRVLARGKDLLVRWVEELKKGEVKTLLGRCLIPQRTGGS